MTSRFTDAHLRLRAAIISLSSAAAPLRARDRENPRPPRSRGRPPRCPQAGPKARPADAEKSPSRGASSGCGRPPYQPSCLSKILRGPELPDCRNNTTRAFRSQTTCPFETRAGNPGCLLSDADFARSALQFLDAPCINPPLHKKRPLPWPFSRGQYLPALGATARQHAATAFRRHALPETVVLLPLANVRLIGRFHRDTSPVRTHVATIQKDPECVNVQFSTIHMWTTAPHPCILRPRKPSSSTSLSTRQQPVDTSACGSVDPVERRFSTLLDAPDPAMICAIRYPQPSLWNSFIHNLIHTLWTTFPTASAHVDFHDSQVHR